MKLVVFLVWERFSIAFNIVRCYDVKCGSFNSNNGNVSSISFRENEVALNRNRVSFGK